MFLGRIVTPGEPVWTDKDREWAIALHLEEQNTHACGHPIDEVFAKESDGKYVGEAFRCHACAAIAKGQTAYASDEHASTDGLIMIARRL